MASKKQGFSLIEVLVVTAIIMLLVALLMPIISSVRMSAHKTVCISNEKQLGLALEMYANDYKGYFPKEEDRAPPGAWYGNGYYWSHWGMKLEPYIDKLGKTKGYKTNKIMKCPSDGYYTTNSWSENSYAYNSHISIDYRTPRFIPFTLRSEVAILVDGYAYFSIWSSTAIHFRHDTRRTSNNFGPARIGGTTNALFGDLSVQNLKEFPNEMRKWY